MRTFLIFERAEPHHVPAATGTGQRGGVFVDTRTLLDYNCLGGVKAPNEQAAVEAVIRTTRRVSAFAVVEAVFIDLTREDDEPDETRALLNP